MVSISAQLEERFPDINTSDIHRILKFVGFTPDDIYNPNPTYRMVKGQTIFIQSPVVEEDIAKPDIDINVIVRQTQNGITIDISHGNGTVIAC